MKESYNTFAFEPGELNPRQQHILRIDGGLSEESIQKAYQRQGLDVTVTDLCQILTSRTAENGKQTNTHYFLGYFKYAIPGEEKEYLVYYR